MTHAAAIEQHCPYIEPSCWEELALVMAAAVHGFLKGQLDTHTLWTVFAVSGAVNDIEWLKLPAKQHEAVMAARHLSGSPNRSFPGKVIMS